MPFMVAAPLAYAGIAASVIGTGVSVYGAMESAQTQKQTAAYNAQLAANQATTVQQQSQEAAVRQMANDKALMAQQQGSYVAHGIQIDGGTPLAVAAQSSAILKLNMLDRKAATDAQASSLFSQGQADLAYGQAGAAAANIRGAASLFGGIGSTAMDYTKLSKAGVFN